MMGPVSGVATTSTEIPSYKLIEFLSCLGSVVSFWFGGSVLTLFRLIKLIKSKSIETVNDNQLLL